MKGVEVKVFGLLRVSKGATNGSSHAVQREAIEVEAKRRGDWDVTWIEETVTGSGAKARPQLDKALAALAAGEAQALVVSKLDRLSRSMIAFVTLMEQSKAEGWAIIALDIGIDTSTPSGRMIASSLANFAQYEREVIGARTKDALRVKRDSGKVLGRPRTLDKRTRARIKSLRSRGHTYKAIADRLNADGTPTAQGGEQWWPATVRAVVNA